MKSNVHIFSLTFEYILFSSIISSSCCIFCLKYLSHSLLILFLVICDINIIMMKYQYFLGWASIDCSTGVQVLLVFLCALILCTMHFDFDSHCQINYLVAAMQFLKLLMLVLLHISNAIY
jgi:hypothetical protein